MESLEERVMQAKKDKELLNVLIRDYKPFILTSAYKTVGIPVNDSDDIMSIALIAFSEAVQSYEPQKGNFINFSEIVIKRRIIDYLRFESRHKWINFSELESVEEEEDSYISNIADESINFDNDPVKLEIEALTQCLKEYKIKFSDLVKISPKAKKTKIMCAKVVKLIINNPDILESIRKTGQLPVKKIMDFSRVPQKIIERYRKYIIVVVEILDGDYAYLSDYVSFVKEVGS